MRRHFFSILSIASKNPNTSPKTLHHLSLISRPKHRISPDQSVSTHGFSTAAQESKSAPTDAVSAVSAIVDEISGLTLLEVSDLTELLRQRFDVGEMPIMAVMMPGMSAGGLGRGAAGKAGAKVEEKAEKTAFDLKLESFDAASKIKIIKEVRTFTDLGLKEAKELVEKAPALLKKGVTKEEAQKIVEKMKEVGAKVVME